MCDAVVHLRRRAAGADVTEKPERLMPPEVVIGQRDLAADEPRRKKKKEKENQRSAPLNSGTPSVRRNGPLGSFIRLLFLPAAKLFDELLRDV